MRISTLLPALKYIGVIVSGAYGTYATVTDFYVQSPGGRVLSTQGYFGIGLLLTSTVLALMSDVLKNIKEKKELEEKAQKERTERKAQLERERILLEQLQAQIDLTKTVSHNLETTAARVEKTADTTSIILQQDLERVEYFEVELFIDVNPLAIRYENGEPILSKKLIKAFEDEQQRGKQLSVDLFDQTIEEMRENYYVVRKTVFKGWEIDITLDRSTETAESFSHDMSIRCQREDGVASFVISHMSGDERTMVQCWVVYRIPPNRAAGFRTFRDFNGASLSFTLEAKPGILDLTTLRVHMDAGGEFKPIFLQSEKFQKKGKKGSWSGTMQIPVSHF